MGRLDVVVVGGGPAGLATALHAAAAGLSVVVRERHEGVLDKACGEGVMPGGLSRLAALGVHPRGREIVGIRYCADGRAAQTRFRGATGRGVRRTELHEVLRDAVLAAGVTIEHVRVREVHQDDGGVIVDGTETRYLVAADGLHSPLRRALGLEERSEDRSAGGGDAVRSTSSSGRRPRYGLRQHVVRAPWTDHVEVHWAEHGEAYVTPVADDLVGIAVLTSRRAPFHEHLDAFPELRARLDGAAPATAVRGAGPLRQDATRRVSGRALLVGDAAGYLDAITGEGISLALAQAEAAVAAVLADDPDAYERRWRAIVRRHRLLTGALLAVGGSPGRRLLVPAAQRLPRVFAAAVNEVGRG